MTARQRTSLDSFLIVGNIFLSLPAFALAIGLLAVVLPRVVDGRSPTMVLLPLVAICLLLTLVGASYLRGARGFSRGDPQGPNMTRVALNISLVPWALMVLRGAYDLISDGTTEWKFFIPGVIMMGVLLGYRHVLKRHAAGATLDMPSEDRAPHS